MSTANEALADVRGWLCDNLSEGDAGKVCGMLSVVSRHIVALEDENAKLKKAMDFQALELGCMTDSRDYMYLENEKLRRLARGLNWCTENAKMPSAECEYCPLGDAGYGELSCERLMRELAIEVES